MSEPSVLRSLRSGATVSGPTGYPRGWSGGVPADAPSGQSLCLRGLAVTPADRIVILGVVLAHGTTRAVLGADSGRHCLDVSSRNAGRHFTVRFASTVAGNFDGEVVARITGIVMARLVMTPIGVGLLVRRGRGQRDNRRATEPQYRQYYALARTVGAS